MSANTVTDNELKAAIAGVFGDVPQDDLHERVTALCQGMYDDSDAHLDREWVEQNSPEYERWLHRLKALELSYQDRVSAFLEQCREVSPDVPELFDEHAQVRVDRALTAATEYFESVMPDEMLTVSRTDFYVDTQSRTAWWIADDDEPGVELPLALSECLASAGEFSPSSTETLLPVFVEALCDGTAPLPGFEFQARQDSLAAWEWVSTEEESGGAAQPQSAAVEFELASEAEAFALYEVPAAQELNLWGCAPLPEDAAKRVPNLVTRITHFGVPGRVVLREVGVPLGLVASRASRSGNMEQFRRANHALSALTSALEQTDATAVTAE